MTTLIGERGPTYVLRELYTGLNETVFAIKDFYVVLYIYSKMVLGLILCEKVEVVFKA